MKIILMSLMILLGACNASANDTGDIVPDREVQIGLTGVYVPSGVDTKGDAYVVVSGVFQNGCYKWSRAETNNKDDFNHEIISMAKVTPGMCTMVLIPFQKEVKLGHLSVGRHFLKFVNGDGTYLEKTLVIE